MALRRWICTSSTKTMLVMIVHPGGHVELHDRPLLASEVMNRNPRCIVAHPHVFREPASAIVSPDTMLMLGQKFYVVPVSTIRKLRRNPFKYSPDSRTFSSPSPEENPGMNERREEERASGTSSTIGNSEGSGKCFMCRLGRDLARIFASSDTNKKRSDHSKDPPSKGSPIIKVFSSLEYWQWQPNLESIIEE